MQQTSNLKSRGSSPLRSTKRLNMDIIELIAFIIVALLLLFGVFGLQYIIFKVLTGDLTEKEMKEVERSLYKREFNDLI